MSFFYDVMLHVYLLMHHLSLIALSFLCASQLSYSAVNLCPCSSFHSSHIFTMHPIHNWNARSHQVSPPPAPTNSSGSKYIWTANCKLIPGAIAQICKQNSISWCNFLHLFMKSMLLKKTCMCPVVCILSIFNNFTQHTINSNKTTCCAFYFWCPFVLQPCSTPITHYRNAKCLFCACSLNGSPNGWPLGGINFRFCIILD